jgi:hypothetical protein
MDLHSFFLVFLPAFNLIYLNMYNQKPYGKTFVDEEI